MNKFLLVVLSSIACHLNAGWLIISDGNLTTKGPITVKENKIHFNTKDIESNGNVVVVFVPTKERDSLYLISKEDLKIAGNLIAEGDITFFGLKDFRVEAPINGKNVKNKISKGEVEELIIPSLQGKWAKVNWIRGENFDGDFLFEIFK